MDSHCSKSSSRKTQAIIHTLINFQAPKMAPSPLAGSPMPSPASFLGHNGTPPPAHSGFGGRGICSPFGPGYPQHFPPHFPVPMCTPENMNVWASYNFMQHSMMEMMNRGNMISPSFRPSSPFPTMAPSSPFSPFMMGSPGHPMLSGGFSHHFMPPSPDANGR